MSEYPERRLSIPPYLRPFRFSTVNVDWARQDLELRLNALENVLAKFKRNTTLTPGVPILHPLLDQCQPTGEELRHLAKVLNRLAPLVDEQRRLRSQLGVLEVAATEPTFFEWAFADHEREYASELDAELERLQEPVKLCDTCGSPAPPGQFVIDTTTCTDCTPHLRCRECGVAYLSTDTRGPAEAGGVCGSCRPSPTEGAPESP